MPHQPRIILVEEDRDLLELLSDYLTGRRIARIDTYGDSLEALNSHLDRPCDLAIVSMTMLDMHFSRFIDHLTAVGRPRAILLAPDRDGDRVLQALRLGAQDVLIKPFDLEELWDSVERSLKLRRRQIASLRRRRRERDELARMRTQNRGLEERVQMLSRDVVTSYRRLARRFGGLRC